MLQMLAAVVLSWILAPIAASNLVSEACPAGVTCIANPETGSALMQRRTEAAGESVRPAGHPVSKSKPKQKPATHALAAELTRMAANRGPLDTNEINHIQSIKDVISVDIVPGIYDGVEETRQEVAMLYEAVVNCTVELNHGLKDAERLENVTEKNGNDHRDCRKKEDDIKSKKDTACSNLDEARIGINPPQLDFELGIDITDEQMHRYFQIMEEFYCGRGSTFEETLDECEDAGDNETTTGDACDDLQQDFEESWCTWKVELESTCSEFDQCWTNAVAAFNKRKGEIENLEEARKEEYLGAKKVNCLWDAWDLENEPCTVNETKVKECEDNIEDPDLSNITIEFPVLPVEPSCSIEPVSTYPCNADFVATHYTSIGLAEELLTEIKQGCSACPATSEDNFPQTDDDDNLPFNMLFVGLHSYQQAGSHKGRKAQSLVAVESGVDLVNTKLLRTNHILKSAGSGCDGHAATKFDVAGVSIQMMEVASKAKLEFIPDGSGISSLMELDNGVAEAAGKVTDYSINDWMGIIIRGDKVIFAKNSVPFATIPAGSALKGQAKVTMCTLDSTLALRLVGTEAGDKLPKGH